MAEPHPLILSLRCAGLKDVDTCNLDEVHNMWAALSRAKNCIDGGDRLEYLSWRIYSREILARKHVSTASAPHKPGPAGTPPHIISPDESEPEVNDSDFESFSEDSDAEVADPTGQKTTTSQRDVCGAKGPPAPQLVASKQKSSRSHPHRRISSIELQHLFKEARNLDPDGLKKCVMGPSQLSERDTAGTPKPIEVPEKHKTTVATDTLATDSLSTEGSLALNAYQHRFGTPTTQRASSKEAQAREISRETPRDSATIRGSSSSLFSRLPETGSSTAVRGFSPSSVSVSVFMNRGLASKPEANQNTSEEHKGGGKLVTWKKASLPREKIFFIEAESDSDGSSAAGSPSRAASGKASKNRLEATEPTTDGNGVDDDDDDDFEDVEDDNDGDDGSSVWDDTSGEEDNSDEEYRPENMFKERVVPSKPLLKRSLLSSLFVNDMSQVTPAQAEPDSDHVDNSGTLLHPRPSTSPPDQSSVAAPVDILLGAAVAPHIPLPVASPRTVRRDMLQTELSQSLRDNMKQSRNFDVDYLFQQRPANGRSFSESAADLSQSETSDSATPTTSSLHMTARPEMYRASTDNGVSYRRPSEERGAWESHHEDIYDPMNYHSRGW